MGGLGSTLLMKCLPCKHENLSSDPRTHIKRQAQLEASVILALRRESHVESGADQWSRTHFVISKDQRVRVAKGKWFIL